jgi:hypothetical protein
MSPTREQLMPSHKGSDGWWLPSAEDQL